MACKPSCKLCKNLVISQAVTVITVDGTDTLVIDLPVRAYNDNCKYCIIVAQTIPATATINMPVAFSIGGDTTTVFPFVNKCCEQATACQIRTRTRYSTRVETNATGGVFKSLGGLSCACPANTLESLPVPTTTATTFAVRENVEETPTPVKTTKTTTKEVVEYA